MFADNIAANGKAGTGASLFTKSRVKQVNSKNAEEDKFRRADEVYNKYRIFG